jgi:hypothetical protein
MANWPIDATSEPTTQTAKTKILRNKRPPTSQFTRANLRDSRQLAAQQTNAKPHNHAIGTKLGR